MCLTRAAERQEKYRQGNTRINLHAPLASQFLTTSVCPFLPPEHVSSMVQYLKKCVNSHAQFLFKNYGLLYQSAE